MGKIRIRELEPDDTRLLPQAFANTPWERSPAFFEGYLREHEQGLRTVLVARLAGGVAGHASIVWEARYPGFRERGIPEIQDLNVVPELRRRGVASALLDEAERRVSARADSVGIGFGLHAGYGAAQRLYVRRGYVPDGRGVFLSERSPAEGERVPLNDELVLHLVKSLEPTRGGVD